MGSLVHFKGYFDDQCQNELYDRVMTECHDSCDDEDDHDEDPLPCCADHGYFCGHGGCDVDHCCGTPWDFHAEDCCSHDSGYCQVSEDDHTPCTHDADKCLCGTDALWCNPACHDHYNGCVDCSSYRRRLASSPWTGRSLLFGHFDPEEPVNCCE